MALSVKPDETGKKPGILCGSKQEPHGLKDRMKGQCRKVRLFTMPLPEIVIRTVARAAAFVVPTVLALRRYFPA